MWNSYGDWDRIANAADFDFIKQRITGLRSQTWEPNHVSENFRVSLSGMVRRLSATTEKPVSVVDFGAGLGRNAPLLHEFFPRVIAVDIPEMVTKLAALYEGQITSLYEGVYDDFDEMLAAEQPAALYDSVVIQHIIQPEYNEKLAKSVIESSVSLVICLVHKKVRDTLLFYSKLLDAGWRCTYQEVDSISFEGKAHILRIFVR